MPNDPNVELRPVDPDLGNQTVLARNIIREWLDDTGFKEAADVDDCAGNITSALWMRREQLKKEEISGRGPLRIVPGGTPGPQGP
jgi:hypothetical protein